MALRGSHLKFVRMFASPARKGNKATGAGREDPASSALEKRLIDVLRPIARPPGRTDEERKHLRALMIRYGKLARAHHNELQLRAKEFNRAKWAAVDALPHKRRLEALHTENAPMPKNRPLFTETPPIKGFDSGDITKTS